MSSREDEMRSRRVVRDFAGHLIRMQRTDVDRRDGKMCHLRSGHVYQHDHLCITAGSNARCRNSVCHMNFTQIAAQLEVIIHYGISAEDLCPNRACFEDEMDLNTLEHAAAAPNA